MSDLARTLDAITPGSSGGRGAMGKVELILRRIEDAEDLAAVRKALTDFDPSIQQFRVSQKRLAVALIDAGYTDVSAAAVGNWRIAWRKDQQKKAGPTGVIGR